MNSQRTGALLLLLIGLLQMAGYLADNRLFRGIGAATAASPLPIVFSDVKGLETFASRFSVRLTTKSGEIQRFPISPKEYGRFTGPYNRRNVYGAAISYGPRLPDPLWQSVLRYGFCVPGVLAREMGLGTDIAQVAVEIYSKTANRNDSWELACDCQI